MTRVATPPACHRASLGPFGPEVSSGVSPRVSPKTGVSPGVSHGVSLGPFGRRAPEFPKSVPRVCRRSVEKVLSKGGQQSPRMVRYPPLGTFCLTQAHLCDTSCYNCAIPHKNKHERVLRYYRYKHCAT